MAPPANPKTIDSEFHDLVKQVEGLLKGVFHIATPPQVKDKLLSDLHIASRPLLDELKEENCVTLRELQVHTRREATRSKEN